MGKRKIKHQNKRKKIMENGKVMVPETRSYNGPVAVEKETRICTNSPVKNENGCTDIPAYETVTKNKFFAAAINRKAAHDRLIGEGERIDGEDYFYSDQRKLDRFLCGELRLESLLKDYPIFSDDDYMKLLNVAKDKALILTEAKCSGISENGQISEELQKQVWSLLRQFETTIMRKRGKLMNNATSTLVDDVMAKM